MILVMPSLNRVSGPSRRPEITASLGLADITFAGQRSCDAGKPPGGKTHRPAGDLTGLITVIAVSAIGASAAFIALWRARRTAPVRADYMTPQEHLLEAERLAWAADDVIQTGARRTLGDLIALARLHLELAEAGASEPGETPWAG